MAHFFFRCKSKIGPVEHRERKVSTVKVQESGTFVIVNYNLQNLTSQPYMKS